MLTSRFIHLMFLTLRWDCCFVLSNWSHVFNKSYGPGDITDLYRPNTIHTPWWMCSFLRLQGLSMLVDTIYRNWHSSINSNVLSTCIAVVPSEFWVVSRSLGVKQTRTTWGILGIWKCSCVWWLRHVDMPMIFTAYNAIYLKIMFTTVGKSSLLLEVWEAMVPTKIYDIPQVLAAKSAREYSIVESYFHSITHIKEIVGQS